MHSDILTNTGAVAAAASPWWLPGLQTVSDAAALVLPILGVTWLLVQITLKIYTHFRPFHWTPRPK